MDGLFALLEQMRCGGLQQVVASLDGCGVRGAGFMITPGDVRRLAALGVQCVCVGVKCKAGPATAAFYGQFVLGASEQYGGGDEKVLVQDFLGVGEQGRRLRVESTTRVDGTIGNRVRLHISRERCGACWEYDWDSDQKTIY